MGAYPMAKVQFPGTPVWSGKGKSEVTNTLSFTAGFASVNRILGPMGRAVGRRIFGAFNSTYSGVWSYCGIWIYESIDDAHIVRIDSRFVVRLPLWQCRNDMDLQCRELFLANVQAHRKDISVRPRHIVQIWRCSVYFIRCCIEDNQANGN